MTTKADKENTTIGYHPELYTRDIIVSAAASKNWQGQNGHSCDSSTPIIWPNACAPSTIGAMARNPSTTQAIIADERAKTIGTGVAVCHNQLKPK